MILEFTSPQLTDSARSRWLPYSPPFTAVACRLLESCGSQTEQHSSLAELFEPPHWKVISTEENQLGSKLFFPSLVSSAFSVCCSGWLVFISVVHTCRCHLCVILNVDKVKHLLMYLLYYMKKSCVVLRTTRTIGSSFLWSRWDFAFSPRGKLLVWEEHVGSSRTDVCLEEYRQRWLGSGTKEKTV